MKHYLQKLFQTQSLEPFKRLILTTITERPGKILLSFAALFLVAFLTTGMLEFEQDIFQLLPRQNRTFQLLRHALQTSAAQNRLYLVVRGKTRSQDLIEPVERFCQDLRKIKLDGQPAFTQVAFRKMDAVDPREFENLLTAYLSSPEIFIASDERRELEALLTSPQRLEIEIKHTLALYATPGASRLSQMAALDPLNLRQFMLEKLDRLHQGLSFAPGPYLLSPDQSALLIIVIPAENTFKRSGAFNSMMAVDRIRSAYPELQIGMTGGYALTAQEEALVRGDLLGCLIGSVLGIGILFYLIYRNLAVLVFLLIPLGAGLQLALGTIALFFDRIHMLAMAFATVILGLGIDFAIHLYDRYTAARSTGDAIGPAVEKAVFKTGSAVLAGGLTTLTAFLVISFSDSPILFQIGWLVALGLAFCLVTILWALPAWMVWVEQHFKTWLKRPAYFMGMDKIGQAVNRHPKVTLLLSLLGCLLALPGIPQINFEKDPLALRPQNLEAIDVQQDLIDTFGEGQEYVLIAWHTSTAAALWKKGRALDPILTAGQRDNIVSNWISINRLSTYAPISSEKVNPAVIRELLKNYGLHLDDFKILHHFLQSMTDPRKRRVAAPEISPSGDECQQLQKFPQIFNRFFICENKTFSGIAWVQVPDPTAAQELKNRMKQSHPEYLVVNPRLAVQEFVDAAKGELKTAVIFATLLILFILFLFLRRPGAVLLVLIPMLMGLLTTMGMMGHFGIQLNVFNFIVLPILIGIGIDDGIHIYRRHREMHNIEKTLATTGRSILVTTLTTICGFGSLALADYHVLKSIGLSAAFGVSACFIYSITTLPSLLKLRTRSNDRTKA